MKLHNLTGREKEGYTEFGCVWKRGEVWPGTGFLLKNENGEERPVQSRVTAFWPDGSVKWTAHTADTSGLTETVTVEAAEEQKTIEGIRAEETEEGWTIHAGRLRVAVCRRGEKIFREIVSGGKTRAAEGRLNLWMEERKGTERRLHSYTGEIREAELEEKGPLEAVVRWNGIHRDEKGEEKIPFCLRMYIGYQSEQLRFVYTFFYDGNPEKDFLKGIGIHIDCPVRGKPYNRHVKFGTDWGVFHEAAEGLTVWQPPLYQELYRRQMQGEVLKGEEENALLEAIEGELPFWDEYHLCQDSPTHFAVYKKIREPECCFLDGLHGQRAPGTAAVCGEDGGLLGGIRDFWEKYPSGIGVTGLTAENAGLDLWFYSPFAEAMDFRHYAARSYPYSCYEGFPELGAEPDGIGNTGECILESFDGGIVPDSRMEEFCRVLRKPPVYIGEPKDYHEQRLFGGWSLISRETEVEEWLEDQMEKAFSFYKEEQEQRNWYGIFNYGDVMHTYDGERHVWRYDVGGYAWQNTELMPTLWLWLAFLRSGREDIFTMARAMSRHCSEVDVYHFGPLQGMGSRHNVRHWGCPCKEVRIAMAGHHRIFYYLTGDRRMGDIFREVKDAEQSMAYLDPLRHFYDKEKMAAPTHARSGPDWSSLCSDWMTEWERFGEEKYFQKIKTGMDDLKKMPLRLLSGPDFEFDPDACRLRYIGEVTKGGCHLQICLGAAQVWIELGELSGDEEWKEMLAEYGRFYFLPREQQREESGGKIGDREFSLPFMAAAMGAYAAKRRNDLETAKRVWKILLFALAKPGDLGGFAAQKKERAGNRRVLEEIPWITTNFTAQWCLNCIAALEFIRKELPETKREMEAWMEGMPEERLHHKA